MKIVKIHLPFEIIDKTYPYIKLDWYPAIVQNDIQYIAHIYRKDKARERCDGSIYTY